MYKHLALTLACLAGTAAVARAQATADAPVTVAVQSTLALNETGTTDFGTVNNNAGTLTVDPAAPATGTTTAMFTATGTPGAHIGVSWPSTVGLQPTDHTAVINFTPKMSSASASTDQATSAALSNGGTVVLNASGNAFLWMGGSVTVANNQKPASYSGTVTVTVTYN